MMNVREGVNFPRIRVWHLEVLDGCVALLDENQSTCQYRDELTRTSVQYEASD
jgi:hypothetical protein